MCRMSNIRGTSQLVVDDHKIEYDTNELLVQSTMCTTNNDETTKTYAQWQFQNNYVVCLV